MSKSNISGIPAVLAIAATLLVTGCGGGEVATLLAGVGSGGTGAPVRIVGTLTGFGSLIVDGMRRDEAMAAYMSEEDQGPAMAMASTGMMLGHSVDLGLDTNDSITTVLVSPELVGTVSAVGADGITLLGTNVTINRDTAAGPVTVLAGYAAPTAIQVGDRVAVYGLLKTDSQGATYVQATLIVQKPLGSGIRLTGYVSQYNATAGTLVVGNQTVKIGSATLTPAGTALANGQLITIWSTTPPTGNSITASTIRIKAPAGSGEILALSGAISAYASAANFKVRNVIIDATNATLSPSGAVLADNKYVLVVGRYDATSGKLTATAVTIYAPSAPASVELHGTVMNFVSPSSFTVRGVVVDAGNATITGGTSAQVTNGVFVEVFGAVVNNVVKATTLRIVALTPQNAPGGAMLDLMGTVTSYDAATGNYTMMMNSGVTLAGRTGAAMFFDNGTAAGFAVGQSVSVRGAMSNGVLATSVVSFSPTSAASGSGATHMEGIAYNVTPTSFMLNGVTIQNGGNSLPGGAMMGNGMMAGGRVAVEVKNLGGQLVATAIRLQGGS